MKMESQVIKEEVLLSDLTLNKDRNSFLIAILPSAEARNGAMRRITELISMKVFCCQEVLALTPFRELHRKPSNAVSSLKQREKGTNSQTIVKVIRGSINAMM